MPKAADRYLQVDPWAVIEEGFDPARSRVSESIFSLSNEYMGVRGYAEEGYGGDTLLGSYFNGLFEQMEIAAHYKGIIRSLRYMVNSVDWLYTRLTVDGETLDLSESKFTDYRRKLDFRTGLYTRELTWHTNSGKILKLRFERLVSMTRAQVGGQRITLVPVNFSGTVQLRTGLDFSILHEDQGKNLWRVIRKAPGSEKDLAGSLLGATLTTGNRLYSAFAVHSDQIANAVPEEEEKYIGLALELQLEQGKEAVFDKLVSNVTDKQTGRSDEEVWTSGSEAADALNSLTLDELMEEQRTYWAHVWETSDIQIEGDPDNQQGIRFCIFQLVQTYHGDHPGFNIGAKGLTGEAYRGLAFWDTESYCLPFYIFNNPKAAKSLLEFRYQSLPQALERAKEVDCEGAFYPIATIDGTESCDLWQHSNLQLHVGTAIAYGLWRYEKIVGDKPFLYEKGAEMLLQISRFYRTRGQWGQKSGQFGYYGVMGPDEFQLMVNNNAYTNYMAKKLFEYTLEVAEEMKREVPQQWAELAERLGLQEEELSEWRRLADHMKIPKDDSTGVYEEHDGFFDMPHIEIQDIPVTDFPLYSNWSYDRIYRYDMIKQPDVLMFLLLHNQSFSLEEKRANYEFYEPKTIHESSLSPSVHSILAAEIGRHEEAYKFFEFATRLDLDNYNRNTREGLHTTSIAAAWMNIVYGFGGMRSDGPELLFQPTIPEPWSSYSFRITYRDTVIAVQVTKDEVRMQALEGEAVAVQVYGQSCRVDAAGVTVALKSGQPG
ncbi:glycoside hydrolase family 65 protein [Paenibacillus physcomitrellae]|uniref:Maltose phosphorylase n=1 Tax=Paenibacillus physcomitrellae TaxID=1619311 RepID=A0ABQ1GTD7_9BACL|nr:glycosyl hydrolase family 65 protein [Paenibacillus physcomitrellae]GGA50003.1 maltose phosphorylase [Paenibacillus physcomitrellae]